MPKKSKYIQNDFIENIHKNKLMVFETRIL